MGLVSSAVNAEHGAGQRSGKHSARFHLGEGKRILSVRERLHQVFLCARSSWYLFLLLVIVSAGYFGDVHPKLFMKTSGWAIREQSSLLTVSVLGNSLVSIIRSDALLRFEHHIILHSVGMERMG